MSIAVLQNYSSKIEYYLSELKSENENIQAGKNTPLDNLPLIIDNLRISISNAKKEFLSTYLTGEQNVAYAVGAFTLDSILKHDLVCFYNTLQKLFIFAEGLYGNISSYPARGTISFYANADEYTLSSDQFDGDNDSKVLDDSYFEYYTVQMGDTSRIIANRTTGDPEKYINILRLNKISESELISGSLVGTKIKIPIDEGTVTRSEENLVYESDMSDVDKFIFGSGIHTDANNNLVVSARGDLACVSGVDNVMNSITARLETKKGTLNVFSENFGVVSIGDGNQPLLVRIERFLTDYANQIQEDPRVESVQIDMNSISLQGEKLSVKSKIYFIETSQSREVEL